MANRPTGFLENYALLKPDPKDSHRLVYERAGWKKTDYTSAVFEPTVVRLGAADQRKITDRETADLAAYGDAALRKAFGKELKIVATVEPGTLRVRSAITGVDTSSRTLNVITGVLLWPVDNGGVSVEFEVRDAVSGELVAALVGFSEGTPLQVIGSFSRFGHAHSGLDHWSVELRKLVHPTAVKPAAK